MCECVCARSQCCFIINPKRLSNNKRRARHQPPVRLFRFVLRTTFFAVRCTLLGEFHLVYNARRCTFLPSSASVFICCLLSRRARSRCRRTRDDAAAAAAADYAFCPRRVSPAAVGVSSTTRVCVLPSFSCSLTVCRRRQSVVRVRTVCIIIGRRVK